MISTIILCLYLLSFFPLLSSTRQFYETWVDDEFHHWERWGAPNPGVFYLGMVIFYFPVIFGKECENLGNKKLLAKRKDVRFFVLIHVLLLLASQLQSGAR